MKHNILFILLCICTIAVNAQTKYEPSDKYWIDFGLPSGTLWGKSTASGMFTYEEAIRKYGNQIPTKEQWEELLNYSSTWYSTAIGPFNFGIYIAKEHANPNTDDNYIVLVANGRQVNGSIEGLGQYVSFWLSGTKSGMHVLGYNPKLYDKGKKENFRYDYASVYKEEIKCWVLLVKKKSPTSSPTPRSTSEPTLKRRVPAGYVDFGLPSGTLWKRELEPGLYTYAQAVATFGNKLPTKVQCEELIQYCKWTPYSDGFYVSGNGNSIFLRVTGDKACDGTYYPPSKNGNFISSTAGLTKDYYVVEYYPYFPTKGFMKLYNQCVAFSVLLVR